MRSPISRETRIIWRRRIQGFWEEFSRKKIGVVGVVLLLLFVFMAVLAPWLTTYDPIGSERIADGFAVPDWFSIFPAYQNLPHTRETTLDWNKKVESQNVLSWGRNVTVECKKTSTDVTYAELNSIFTYTEEVAPKTLFVEFTWSASQVQDIEYTIKVSLVNIQSHQYLLYSRTSLVSGGEQVHVDSIDPILMTQLGFSPGADILATIMIPTKGDYEFLLEISWSTKTSNASGIINFRDMKIVTLGQIHGILGTDSAGADIWSQLVWGARISLMIGLIAAVLETTIGLIVGVVTGYLGGLVDEAMMRVVDILLCLPVLPLLLTLVFLFGKSIFYIVLFVAVFGWQGLARVVRSQVLSLRESSFVECAQASGGSKTYIMLKHMVPNVLPVAFASLVLSVPAAILFEASLSFLGFGDPRVPTWGKMLQYAFSFGGFSHYAWYWILPPGLCITGLCLAFVFMGYAVDEVVNPRLRRRK
jgi:peptide/nickel transport system permease protein